MLMTILLVIAALSLLTILVVIGAMWWRLRRHLRRSDHALQQALADVHPEQEHAE